MCRWPEGLSCALYDVERYHWPLPTGASSHLYTHNVIAKMCSDITKCPERDTLSPFENHYTKQTCVKHI